jgi:hypothetical protein
MLDPFVLGFALGGDLEDRQLAQPWIKLEFAEGGRAEPKVGLDRGGGVAKTEPMSDTPGLADDVAATAGAG